MQTQHTAQARAPKTRVEAEVAFVAALLEQREIKFTSAGRARFNKVFKRQGWALYAIQVRQNSGLIQVERLDGTLEWVPVFSDRVGLSEDLVRPWTSFKVQGHPEALARQLEAFAKEEHTVLTKRYVLTGE